VTAACPLEVRYERVGESNASVVEIGRQLDEGTFMGMKKRKKRERRDDDRNK